jgi:hypothetical protein
LIAEEGGDGDANESHNGCIEPRELTYLPSSVCDATTVGSNSSDDEKENNNNGNAMTTTKRKNPSPASTSTSRTGRSGGHDICNLFSPDRMTRAKSTDERNFYHLDNNGRNHARLVDYSNSKSAVPDVIKKNVSWKAIDREYSKDEDEDEDADLDKNPAAKERN